MIRLVAEGQTLHEVNQFVFNDGSVQVEIQGDLPNTTTHVLVEAVLKTPADQMALVMVVNAIRIACPIVEVHCMMPFTPYGRQDAPFCKGQANSMKAWAAVVNSLGFRTVTVLDPHSIAISHLDNCNPIDITDILDVSVEFHDILFTPGIVLVSPDAGANKKAHTICKKFGISKLVRADKARDLATGNIIETEVYGDVFGETCVIVDDLCDGGMTFIKLAEALRSKGAARVILFVTHGLFTKGLSVFDGLIDEIYTTESWPQNGPSDITEGYNGKFVVCGVNTAV